MKKYVGLFVLLLALSTTTWGACKVDVSIDGTPACGASVSAHGVITCSGTCSLVRIEKSQICNTTYFDVYLRCTDRCGTSTIEGTREVLEEATCGLYMVVVRVHCTYTYWPYCIFQRPIFCGMGSTWFKVCCPECGCWPCCCPCCPPPQPCPPPCCPCPDNNTDSCDNCN